MEQGELSSNWKKLQARLQQEKRDGKRKDTGVAAPTGGVSKHKKPSRSTGSNGSRKLKAKHEADSPGLVRRSIVASSLKHPSSPPTLGPTSAQRPADVQNGGLTPGLTPGKYVALDCEMVGVGPKPDDHSVLARVSAVDFHGVQLYDSFVLPKEPVTDYRTPVSGITPSLLRPGYARTFEQVVKDIDALIHGRILIGHAVQNDLAVLMLKHPQAMIRDTSSLKAYREIVGGRRPKLKDLAKLVLGVDIQSGQHSSVEDARVTMALFQRKKQAFEEGMGSTGGRSKPLLNGTRNSRHRDSRLRKRHK